MGIWFQYMIVEGSHPSVCSPWTVMEGMTLERLRTLSAQSGIVLSNRGEAIHSTEGLSDSVWWLESGEVMELGTKLQIFLRFMCACVYVCGHVCMCMHAYMCVCTHVWVCVCVCHKRPQEVIRSARTGIRDVWGPPTVVLGTLVFWKSSDCF